VCLATNIVFGEQRKTATSVRGGCQKTGNLSTAVAGARTFLVLPDNGKSPANIYMMNDGTRTTYQIMLAELAI